MRSLGAVTILLWAASPGRAEAASVSLRESGGAYELRGEFTVAASRGTVWAVLTDYEHIEDFVSSIKSSRVVERREGGALIEQKTRGKAFFLSKTISLWLLVKENPPGEIAFQDVSRRDFDLYQGRWTSEEAPGGTRVVYDLAANPSFAVPGWLARSAFRGMVEGLLEEVRQEILARKGK
jgi:hypothetical protein